MKTAWFFVICSLLLPGFGDTLNCSSPTPKSLFVELEKELLSRKLLRPVKRFSDPLNVSLRATLVGIIGLDEKHQGLTTFFWLLQKWNIQGLSWDEEECGTSRVTIPRKKLWIPDTVVDEFMEQDMSPVTPYVHLDNRGQVIDDKPFRIRSYCKMDIFTFPFDIQNCSLTFGSYIHTENEVVMRQGHSAKEAMEEFEAVRRTKGEWQIKNIQITEVVSDIPYAGNYSEIIYFVILKRRPVMYVVNLLVPSCFLITLDLFSFLLPPATADRSAFKMTLILGYIVFLNIINDLLPVTGEQTSLLNVFFSISLALMVTSLLETIFITNVQFKSNNYIPVPHWLSVLVLRYFAPIVCLPRKEKSTRVTVCLSTEPKALQPEPNVSSISPKEFENIDSSIHSDKLHPDSVEDELRKLSNVVKAIRLHLDRHFEGSKTSQEWQMIGVVIDRMLFGLYLIFITVSFVVVVTVWVTSDKNLD